MTTGPAEYFAELQEIFAASAALHGGPSRCAYRLANHRLELNFAHPDLQRRLSAAFGHLETATGAVPGLSVSVWDEAHASRPIPRPPWTWEHYQSRGEVGGFSGAPFRIWYDIAAGIFSMIDLESGSALAWVRNPATLPIYVSAAPFRMILQAWLSGRGCYFAHAAAVGTAAGAVMLAGAGGAGKSTTSLACLAAGLDFLGDDYCLFTAAARPMVFSVYSSAKLNPAMLPRLPQLDPAVQRDAPVEDKRLLLLTECFGARLARSRPVLALLVPSIGDKAATTVERVPSLEAIRALAPTTMRQIAGPDPGAWRAITALARKVPSFRIRLGYDLDSVARRVSALLQELASS